MLASEQAWLIQNPHFPAAETTGDTCSPKVCRCAALEGNTWCVRCSWAFRSKVRTNLCRRGVYGDHWGICHKKGNCSLPYFPLHSKLTQTFVTILPPGRCQLSVLDRHLLYLMVTLTAGSQCLWTLQTEILDVNTCLEEETSEECVSLIFILPWKWRVFSVWLTFMFFTCDIFKLWDPALIECKKVQHFSHPTLKGLMAR